MLQFKLYIFLYFQLIIQAQGLDLVLMMIILMTTLMIMMMMVKIRGVIRMITNVY